MIYFQRRGAKEQRRNLEEKEFTEYFSLSLNTLKEKNSASQRLCVSIDNNYFLYLFVSDKCLLENVSSWDIISQSETPGLGANCTKDKFKNQFIVIFLTIN